jgi:two-component system NarL family sensor kinase
MKKLVLCFTGFTLLQLSTAGQEVLNKESLLKISNATGEDSTKAKLYYTLANQYINFDLKEAEKFCRQGLTLSRKIKYQQGELDYYTIYSSILNSRDHFDKLTNNTYSLSPGLIMSQN